jgi:hypothetical protein
MEYCREVDGGQRCGKSGITHLHRFASSSYSSSSTPLQVKGIHFSPCFFLMLWTKIVPNFDKFLSKPLASGLNFFPPTEKKFQVLTSIHQDLLPLYNCFIISLV